MIDCALIGGLLLAPAFADAVIQEASREVSLPTDVTQAWHWLPSCCAFRSRSRTD
jgi:hypothetical protein